MSEALAAGVATIPPKPSVEPLSNTPGEVGGMQPDSMPPHLSAELKRQTSPHEKKLYSTSPLQPTLSKGPAENTQADTARSIPTPPPQPLSPVRLFLVACIVTTTMVMSAGGQQALNIALPTIQTDLNMLETDLQWISSAYSLTSGCFLLLAGRLADVHGRKLVFLCGISWYSLWCLVGGFMRNSAGLVVTRALAGSGASMR
jgi:hypothetical protein